MPYAQNTRKRVVPILPRGGALQGWPLFKFGRLNHIDATKEDQLRRLVKDLRQWIGVGGEQTPPVKSSGRQAGAASKEWWMEPIIAARSKQTAAPPNTINGHAFVDLGLSVKWATCNVGASSPKDYGDYFAWGETSTKGTYTEENSKTSSSFAYIDDIGGDSSLDAARAHWGGTWRLPTMAEAQELKDRCQWEWIAHDKDGKDGYKVTGPSGKSIFLPAAGYRLASSPMNDGHEGFYWTSTPRSRLAFCLNFGHWYRTFKENIRYVGCPIRPVSG